MIGPRRWDRHAPRVLNHLCNWSHGHRRTINQQRYPEGRTPLWLELAHNCQRTEQTVLLRLCIRPASLLALSRSGGVSPYIDASIEYESHGATMISWTSVVLAMPVI